MKKGTIASFMAVFTVMLFCAVAFTPSYTENPVEDRVDSVVQDSETVIDAVSYEMVLPSDTVQVFPAFGLPAVFSMYVPAKGENMQHKGAIMPTTSSIRECRCRSPNTCGVLSAGGLTYRF